MDACPHGMDAAWCYLCRIDASGADPRTAWGLDALDGPGEDDWEEFTGPMTDAQAGHLRFLCREFGESFDGTLTEGQAALVIVSFLEEPMRETQARTLTRLCERAGTPLDPDLTYGEARTAIRRLVALRGLQSA